MSSAGGQMLLGIRLTMDAKGVVTGASLAETSLDGVAKKAQTTSKTVTKEADKMATAMKRSMAFGLAGIASLGVANKIKTGFLNPIIEQAGTLEVAMEQLRFVSQATDDQFKKLGETAIQTGLSTQFSPQEATDTMTRLIAGGLELREMYASLPGVLDLVTASMGQLDLVTGGQAVVGFLNKYRHSAETAAGITDKWAKATTMTALQFKDMPQIMRSMRDSASKLKAPLESSLAVLGVLRAQLSAGQAGQAYSGFARSIIMAQARVDSYMRREGIKTMGEFFDLPSKKLPRIVRAFQDMGVEIFDRTTNKMKNSMQLFGELSDKANSMEKENEQLMLTSMQSVFGVHGQTVINAMRTYERFGKSGKEAFQQLSSELGKSAGFSEKAANAYENTMAGLVKFIQGTQETIQAVMGRTLIPTIMGLLKVFRGLLNTFLEFITANPRFAKALGIMAIALYAVLKVSGLLMIAMAGVFVWSSVVAPVMIAAGGAAGLAAAGFKALQGAMMFAAKTGVVLLALFVALKLGMFLWAKVWEDDAQGIFLSMQKVFIKIGLIWKGLVEFWDGRGSVDLQKALDEAGLWGFVVTLLQVKARIAQAFTGMWQGISEGAKIIALPFQLVFNWLGLLIEYSSRIFEHWGVSDISRTKDMWLQFGRVLGWFTTIILVKFIWSMAAAAIGVAITTGRMILQNAVMLLAIAKYILLAAAVMIVVAAYVELISIASEWGAELGPQIYHWVEAMRKWFWKAGFRMMQAGQNMAQMFREGFAGDWSKFRTWVEEQLKWLAAVVGWVFGGTSDKQLAAALPSSLAPPTKRGEEQLDWEYRQRGGGLRQNSPADLERAKMRNRINDFARETVRESQTSRQQDDWERGPSKTLSVEKIEVNVAQASTPQQAEEVAKVVISKIKDYMDEERETVFE